MYAHPAEQMLLSPSGANICSASVYNNANFMKLFNKFPHLLAKCQTLTVFEMSDEFATKLGNWLAEPTADGEAKLLKCDLCDRKDIEMFVHRLKKVKNSFEM